MSLDGVEEIIGLNRGRGPHESKSYSIKTVYEHCSRSAI